MISRKTFWTVAVALALAGLVAGAWIGLAVKAVDDEPHLAAVWAETFETPRQMRQAVDVVVVARPVAVHAGRVAVSENGEDELPFELVELEALRPVKGVAARGETLFLERARFERDGTSTAVLGGDGGPFEIGERYLLFLKRQPDSGYYYQVNPQGRFHLSRGRLETAVPEDPVAAALAGKTLAEALTLLNAKGDPPVSGAA